jgi:ketosteroid isomerase-like protein
MSQENVDMIRDWVSTWEGQDFVAVASQPDRMAPVLEALHPEIEVRWFESVADVETYRGIEGAEHALADWLEPWAEYRQKPIEFTDAGDRVVVTYRQWGRGRASGAEVESEVTQVYAIRDGKIASLREYTSKSAALEAAGLRE